MRLPNLEGYLKFPGPVARSVHPARSTSTEPTADGAVRAEEGTGGRRRPRRDADEADAPDGDCAPAQGELFGAGCAGLPSRLGRGAGRGALTHASRRRRCVMDVPPPDETPPGSHRRRFEVRTAGTGQRAAAPRLPTGAEMLSIGALASSAQGASYYERDGYYASDDPEHRAASSLGRHRRRRARARGRGRCGRLPLRARRPGARRLRHPPRAARPGRRGDPPPRAATSPSRLRSRSRSQRSSAVTRASSTPTIGR